MTDLANIQDGEPLQEPNTHFCKQLVSLASTNHVETSEDIYTTHGMKLIAGGTQISDALYERVVSHKLRKPLESSIEVEDAIGINEMAEAAEKALDSSASLRKLAGWKHEGKTAVTFLKQMRLNAATTTLLNVHHSRNPALLQHCAEVSLLAMGMSKKLQSPDTNFLQSMALAGILHDIGEVYINPELFQHGRKQLAPAEWKQVAAHPVVGEILLRRIENLPHMVPELILEHHERLDGFGYPRGRRGERISTGGQILAAAEVISGLLAKKARPIAHAELAMKLIPGEYSRPIIDLIAKTREEIVPGNTSETETANEKNDLRQSVQALLAKLDNIRKVSEKLEQDAYRFSSTFQKIFDGVMERYIQIRRGLSSTGLNTDVDAADVMKLMDEEDAEIRFEAALIVNEISWRLFELSRIVALQIDKLPAAEGQALLSLETALSGSPTT
ncbi:MAG: HD domain-containing phosphohydrolase [Pseudomonadota bacterium]